MQGHEPMPIEFNLEAEMEIVRNDIATTMTSIYRFKLKEKYYTRKILNPAEKNSGHERALGQTQAQIKAEQDYLKMLREVEKEINTKIVAELEKGKGETKYPDPDWHTEGEDIPAKEGDEVRAREAGQVSKV